MGEVVLSADAFGPNIRRHRKALGLRLQDVADKAGITHVSVSRIEGGGRVGRMETVIAICAALGIGLDQAFAAPRCPTCRDCPPSRMQCTACGAVTDA